MVFLLRQFPFLDFAFSLLLSCLICRLALVIILMAGAFPSVKSTVYLPLRFLDLRRFFITRIILKA
ncbi:ORF199 [White spot syndrome virus]|uniref:ORF199 n=1 Tax=White spot syndrome virus TaxID=342409 RepID=A0A2D3I6S4_9VIRU|nr:ORF199 [White spot syndrome virus]